MFRCFQAAKLKQTFTHVWVSPFWQHFHGFGIIFHVEYHAWDFAAWYDRFVKFLKFLKCLKWLRSRFLFHVWIFFVCLFCRVCLAVVVNMKQMFSDGIELKCIECGMKWQAVCENAHSGIPSCLFQVRKYLSLTAFVCQQRKGWKSWQDSEGSSTSRCCSMPQVVIKLAQEDPFPLRGEDQISLWRFKLWIKRWK